MGGMSQRQVGGRMGRRTNKHGSRNKALMSEINVTPFVDVMLVLLIIFMVTAPLLTAGIEVDLPENAGESLNQPDEPLLVTVTKNGKVHIQDTPVAIDALGAKLKAITRYNTDTRIFVRGDKAVDYGHVIQTIHAINQAGFTKVGLMTEAPGGDR